MEEVFKLCFPTRESHVKAYVNIDIMKAGCLLKANPYSKKELDFRVSYLHALSSKSRFSLTITGKNFFLPMWIREFWLPKQVLKYRGNSRKSMIRDKEIIFF